jgi:hypothetical protein
MSREPRDLLQALADAVGRRGKADAANAIAELGTASFAGVDPVDAESRLKALMGNRWFDLASLLGGTLVPAFEAERGIRKRYGQALVERGELALARSHFERLLATPGIPPSDRYEYLGLIGRTFKQQFVNTERQTGLADGELLRRAIDAYLDGYRADTTANTWHGINAVALVKLAQRRGLARPADFDADAAARAIIRDLLLAEGRTHWDEATLAESRIALEQWDEAGSHLREYLWYPKADAFSFGATLRQLEEIWQIHDPRHPGMPLVTLLRARLLEMEDGRVQLSPGDVRATLSHDAGRYEKVFGTDHFTTLTNYRLGLERCGPVARIGRELERGDGTGFLMRGKDLDERLDGIVLVTNAHVIDPTGESGGLPPEDVVVSFQTMAGVEPSQAFTVSTVLWSSPRTALDATIARLDPTPPLAAPYPVARQMPTKGARVIAVGHPGGGTLSLSLNDNELLDFESPGAKVHYRTPTEGGSSGSPIFTKEWKLVSLHHYGGDAVPRLNGQPGTYQANEGISIQAIREALAAVVLQT